MVQTFSVLLLLGIAFTVITLFSDAVPDVELEPYKVFLFTI